MATLIAFAVGSVLGARLAWPRSGRLIRTLVPVLMVLASIPFYLLAIILIYLFAVVLKWLFPPAGGVDPTRIMRLDLRDDAGHRPPRDAARRSRSSSAASGFWALGMRSQMVIVLGEDYITFAEAKGLQPRRIFVCYGMRNALLPQVTALALSLGHVVSGAVLVEVIFNYPGLGALLYDADPRPGLLRHPGRRADADPDARGAALHRRPDLSAPRPEDPPMTDAASRRIRRKTTARAGSATLADLGPRDPGARSRSSA